MNKAYSKTGIEIKAKELLYPLRRSCPDNVWHELNQHLNEGFAGNRNNWTSRLFSPIVLVISLVLIGAITFVVIEFSDRIGFSAKPQNEVVKPKPQNAPIPKKEVAPPPPPPKPVVVDSSRIKDSLARVAFVRDSIVQHMKQTPQPIPTVTKVDTAALRRYNERLARRHRRDSISAITRINAQLPDSSVHVTRHRAHDTAAQVKTDTSGH